MKLSIYSLLLLATLVNASYGETLQGKVVGISDGDTITVLDSSKTQHKIRLAGIDAPEKSQAYGERSKQYLSDQVLGRSVTVDWNKTDKYGRTIGKVIVNGQDANLKQVQAGLAWHYKQYEKEQSASDRSLYAHAETDARARHIGLWHDATPIPPWDFRHGARVSSSPTPTPVGDDCSCRDHRICTGPKGGRYCFSAGGKKKYL